MRDQEITESNKFTRDLRIPSIRYDRRLVSHITGQSRCFSNLTQRFRALKLDHASQYRLVAASLETPSELPFKSIQSL